MRIVYWPIRRNYEVSVTTALRAQPGVDLTIVRTIEELAAALPGAEALVMNDPGVELAPALGALLRAQAAKLRWIHITNAGHEGLDAAGVPEGIAVTASAGANAPVLAEHIVALMLAFVRRVPEFANATRAGTWDEGQRASMTSLEGQTLVIVGLGFAGRALAKLARALGMHLIAVRHEAVEDRLVDDVVAFDGLHAALARADFIALTVALTPQTHHLIGAAELAACKPSAYLVNVARGAIVDQAALAEALRTGTIAGAGLDVTEPEPLPPGDPLWSAPNLTITAHLAGSTSPMTVRRMGEYAAAYLADVRSRQGAQGEG
jgi:phosphoglycerate dehydrogenase-like enzyme